jgi:hypothetical protein
LDDKYKYNYKAMKKLIIWLAKIFNVDLTVEKIIYKDKIVEVIKEVPKEVIVEKEVIKEIIKEVPVEVIKEVPIYKETKFIALKDEVTNDTYVEGNLVVKGYLYVDGEVSCYKIKEEA